MAWHYFQNKDIFSMTLYLCHMIQIRMLTKITVCVVCQLYNWSQGPGCYVLHVGWRSWMINWKKQFKA
jgi:hypothetical protein